jgi:hypothetical protein
MTPGDHDTPITIGDGVAAQSEAKPAAAAPTGVDGVPISVFLLGMAFYILVSMAPIGVIVLDWTARWSDPPDPVMLWHLGLTLAGGAVLAYWQKHKALLRLPPALEQARELAAQVKTVKDTVTLTPAGSVTTHTEETTTGK